MKRPAEIIANRTYVSLETISEFFEVETYYDANADKVYVGKRRILFEVFDGTSWGTPETIAGKWHRKDNLKWALGRNPAVYTEIIFLNDHSTEEKHGGVNWCMV